MSSHSQASSSSAAVADGSQNVRIQPISTADAVSRRERLRHLTLPCALGRNAHRGPQAPQLPIPSPRHHTFVHLRLAAETSWRGCAAEPGQGVVWVEICHCPGWLKLRTIIMIFHVLTRMCHLHGHMSPQVAATVTVSELVLMASCRDAPQLQRSASQHLSSPLCSCALPH